MASSTSSFFNIPIGQSKVVIEGEVIGNLDREVNSEVKSAVKVYAGKCDDQNVAVKVWPDPAYGSYAETEFNFLKICQSPYVLKAFAYECGLPLPGLSALLVTELMDESLESFIESQKNVDELILLQIALSLAQALKKLHVEGIIHRDIKPANILLRKAVKDSKKEIEVKLADFGSAIKGNEKRICGTPDFLSPEMLRGEDVTSKADIFGFGLTLLIMSHGFELLENNEALSNAVVRLEKFLLKNGGSENIHKDEEYKAIVNAVLGHREFSNLMAAAEHKIERSAGYMELICQCMHSDPAVRCSIDIVISQLSNMMNSPNYAATLPGSDSFSTEKPLISHNSINVTLVNEEMPQPIPPMPRTPKGPMCMSATSPRSKGLFSTMSSFSLEPPALPVAAAKKIVCRT